MPHAVKYSTVNIEVHKSKDFNNSIFREVGFDYTLIFDGVNSIDGFEDIVFLDNHKRYIHYNLHFKNIDFSKNPINIEYTRIYDIKFENCTGLEFVQFPNVCVNLIFVNCPISELSGNPKEIFEIYLYDYKDLSIVDFKSFKNFRNRIGEVNLALYYCNLYTVEHFQNLEGIYVINFSSCSVTCEVPETIDDVEFSFDYYY